MKWLWGAVLALLWSCGAASHDAELPSPVRVDPASAAASSEPSASLEDESASRYGYGDSPLTPLADRLTELVVAALEGRALPEVGLPIEPLHEGQTLVDVRGALDAVPPGLRVIGFGMEIDMLLDARHGGSRMTVMLYLGPTGLRVAYVGLSSGRRGGELPRELAEIDAVTEHLLGVTRAGGLPDLLLGEAERRYLNDERVFAELARERPDEETLARAIEIARATEQPVGYRLDDVGLLLRDDAGQWYTAELDFDDQGRPGLVVLENGPLVTLRPIP